MLPLQHISRAAFPAKPAAQSFIALYSTVSGLTRRKWGLGSTPASLVHSQEEDVRKATIKKKPTAAPLQSTAPDQPTPQPFVRHRATMKESFPEGWAPPRRLSREAMDGIRTLYASNPEVFSTPVLSQKFKISPEAIRRILKSKWEPTREQRARMLERERKGREQYIQERRKEEMERQRTLGRGPSRGWTS